MMSDKIGGWVSRLALFLGSLAITSTFSSVAAASQNTAYPKIQQMIKEIGPIWNGDVNRRMKAAYADVHKTVDNSEVVAHKDLSYGPHALHKLDLYEPRKHPDEAVPVLIFIHGGAFVRGDKSDGLFYDNVGQYFAKHEAVGIIANYRLAPQHAWPAATKDIAAIIAWVQRHAAQYGADPERIFLMGSSAGAAHVANYVFFEELQLNGGDDGVKGAILMSGNYRPRANSAVYYGEDESLWPERSSLNHVAGRQIPLYIVSAEYDPIWAQERSVRLIGEVCQVWGDCPRHEQIPGDNHISYLLELNTKDDSIGHRVRAFMADPRR